MRDSFCSLDMLAPFACNLILCAALKSPGYKSPAKVQKTNGRSRGDRRPVIGSRQLVSNWSGSVPVDLQQPVSGLFSAHYRPRRLLFGHFFSSFWWFVRVAPPQRVQ